MTFKSRSAHPSNESPLPVCLAADPTPTVLPREDDIRPGPQSMVIAAWNGVTALGVLHASTCNCGRDSNLRPRQIVATNAFGKTSRWEPH